MVSYSLPWLFAALATCTSMVSVTESALIESERMQEYTRRNYTWPLEHYTPDTPGWRNLMHERFEQIAEMENSGDRYEGYLQTIHSALLAPNFTELGFGLAKAPDELMATVRKAVRDGAESSTIRSEGPVDVIEGPNDPLFVDRPDLTHRILHELQAYPEAWTGMELVPFRAYGFRLYQNQSSLLMHVDKAQTHVISFILHIDSSDDSEPWPIFIEDFKGRTHEVILKPGDMLFYESSKCFHGRPRKFVGSWYSSIFVHYYPKEGWQGIDHKMEQHYAVPPVWSHNPPANKHEHDNLQMAGTSMKHPDCPDEWCPIKDSVKWSGPGKFGKWIDPDFVEHDLDIEHAPSMLAKLAKDEL